MRGTIGVGAAFRRARASRGISIEQASRDTRIRIEVLEALEEERFEVFPNQVHVRGVLRTYASYLGLPGGQVVDWYRRHVAVHEEEALSVPEAVQRTDRRRDDHRLWAFIAVGVLSLSAVLGIIASGGDQQPLPLPSPGGGEFALGEDVTFAITALRPVTVTVRIDGGAVRSYDLRAGEGRSFQAGSELQIEISDPSAVAVVTVNSLPITLPATRGQPWTQVFRAGAVAAVIAPETGATPSGAVVVP